MTQRLTELELMNLALNVETVFENERALRRQLRETEEQFLDYLNLKAQLFDLNIVETLKMAVKYNTPISRRRVERFLCVQSKKNTIDKWKIAKKYNLEKLKEKCILEAKIAEEENAALLKRLKEAGQLPGVKRKATSENGKESSEIKK